MKKLTLLLLLTAAFNLSAKEVFQFNLRIVYVDDVKDIPIVNKYGYEQGFQLGASFVDPRTGNCTIVVVRPDPEKEDYLHKSEIVFHELRHCTDGAFHK